MYKNEISAKNCTICGKLFIPTYHYAYKGQCSYTCYRKAGGDGGKYKSGEKSRTQAMETYIPFSHEKIEELYKQGLSDAAIAGRVGASPASIHKWRKRNNLPANFKSPKRRETAEGVKG